MHTEEHPLSEYLDFTYSFFGKPEIGRTYIRLPVRQFLVMKGFPAHNEELIYKQGVLLFEGVTSSERRISEYETPQGGSYKPSYVIIDGPFAEVKEEAYLFYLGGFSYDPPGFVEWNIVAVTVRVEGGEAIKPTG